MNEQQRRNLFAELIARHQSELYGYIYAIVRNWEDTDDLYQSVCLVLWSKFESFRPGSSFLAWGCKIAKNKIGDFIRHRRSPIHMAEQLTDVLVERTAAVYDEESDTYLSALQDCRKKLSATDEELLRLRYLEDLTTVQIAGRLQRLQPNVSRSLNRIRRWLVECVQMELARRKHARGNSHE